MPDFIPDLAYTLFDFTPNIIIDLIRDWIEHFMLGWTIDFIPDLKIDLISDLVYNCIHCLDLALVTTLRPT